MRFKAASRASPPRAPGLGRIEVARPIDWTYRLRHDTAHLLVFHSWDGFVLSGRPCRRGNSAPSCASDITSTEALPGTFACPWTRGAAPKSGTGCTNTRRGFGDVHPASERFTASLFRSATHVTANAKPGCAAQQPPYLQCQIKWCRTAKVYLRTGGE